jgi:hypothetical protein
MNTTPTPRKAHRPMTLTAPAVPHNAYGATETEIGANSGSAAISLWMRYASEFNGPGARLTPDQARTLAADLIARANEIEPPAPAPFTEAELSADVSVSDDGRWYRPDGSPATDREAAAAIWSRAGDPRLKLADVERLALYAAEDYSREGSLSEQDVSKWAADFARRVLAGEVSL